MAENSTEQYLLVDCDPGVDDCLALMMVLSQYPRIKTVGITCVNGNVGLREVTINAMRVVKLFNMIDKVPVYQGCSEPLIIMPNNIDSTFYHGEDGFGDVPHIEPKAEEELLKFTEKEHAVQAIIRLSKEYEGKLQILAIGPLTNLALATKLDPELPKRVKSVHILGGTIRGHGNVTPSAEYNFFIDPEAANITLNSFSNHCKVQLLTYEVTIDHACPPDFFEKLLKHDDNKKRLFFSQVYGKASNLEEKDIAQNLSTGYIVCDAYLALIALRPESIVKSKMIRAGVELGGIFARGTLILDHRKKGSPHLTKNEIELIEEIDLASYQDVLLQTFQ